VDPYLALRTTAEGVNLQAMPKDGALGSLRRMRHADRADAAWRHSLAKVQVSAAGSRE
jgi:hypothetical protein